MRPLDGIRVLDLSRVLSGPHAGRMLADLGADVIKLEPPDGDPTRTALPRPGGIPLYFLQQNVGKRNVSIDLRHPDGARIGLELAAACDVVIENYRPGVMDRLGLGYEALRARNPQVVLCSITGWGVAGSRRAYAGVVHAEAGYMELAARKHGLDPMPDAVSHGDIYAGTHAVVGTLAALFNRQIRGEGQHVVVSMAESLLTANEWTVTEIATGGAELPHVFGGYNAPTLRLGDGTWVCVPGDPVASFPTYCRAMERPALLQDPRFETPQARIVNRAAMIEVLREWASGFASFEDFEAALYPVRLAAGAVRSISEAAASDWARQAEAIVDVDDRAGGTIKVPRGPFRFSSLDAGPRGVGAWRGENNHEVLSEVLKLSDAEIARLEAEGVISSRKPG